MRFGIKTSPQETTYDAMRAVWQAADEIELFESAWNFDHFLPIFSDSSGPCMEGWVTLTALAEATSRLRIGCLVTGAVYRHPAVLANMAVARGHRRRGDRLSAAAPRTRRPRTRRRSTRTPRMTRALSDLRGVLVTV